MTMPVAPEPQPQRPGESDQDYQAYLDSLHADPGIETPQRPGESDADYKARLAAQADDPEYQKFTKERDASKAPPVQRPGESDADYEAYLKARQSHEDDPEYLQFLADQRDQRIGPAPVEYWVHLADGQVVTLGAEELATAGTHYDGVAVIGSYQVGA